MKKNHFIKLTKYQFNSVRIIGNLFIRERAWDNNPWQVVDSADFDTARTLEEYRLREELWQAIKERI